MINKIIFDFGGVLLDWNYHYLIDKMFETPDKATLWMQKIHLTELHDEMDLGQEPLCQLVEKWEKRFPDEKEKINEYIYYWTDIFKGQIKGMQALIEEIKEKGIAFYGLSNFSKEMFPVVYHQFPILHYFKGKTVVSGMEGLKKPDLAIYRLLLERFKINPSQAVFIDDKLENVMAAQAVGLTGIQFNGDAFYLRKQLNELNPSFDL